MLVILSKHTFYIRFHLSWCQRNFEQVRLVHLTVIAVPVPQIQEQIVDVIKVILQKQCQRMRFFLLRACGKGAVGGTAHSHARVSVDSECKRRNLEHVVLDRFSHIQTGKIQWLFVSCRGSGFCDLFQLFASFAQLTIRPLTSCEPHSCRCSEASSQRPHLAARLPPCVARA